MEDRTGWKTVTCSLGQMLLSAVLSTLMVYVGPLVGIAHAGVVTTEMLPAYADGAGTADQRQELHRTLDRPEVERELANLGVDPREAHRRIDALSDDQVVALKGRLDDLPAGGFVGAVLAAILIVFFVLLFTDLIGATDVFPWVKKH